MVLVGFSVDCAGLQTSQLCQLLDLGFVLVPTPAEKGGLSEPHQSFPPLPPAVTPGASSLPAEGAGKVAHSSHRRLLVLLQLKVQVRSLIPLRCRAQVQRSRQVQVHKVRRPVRLRAKCSRFVQVLSQGLVQAPRI